jgi:hypothetical protein
VRWLSLDTNSSLNIVLKSINLTLYRCWETVFSRALEVPVGEVRRGSQEPKKLNLESSWTLPVEFFC